MITIPRAPAVDRRGIQADPMLDPSEKSELLAMGERILSEP